MSPFFFTQATNSQPSQQRQQQQPQQQHPIATSASKPEDLKSPPQVSQILREVNDSTSASCRKCVKVLRDLIAGLQQENNHNANANNSSSVIQPLNDKATTTIATSNFDDNNRAKEEAPPLTLLKAISGLTNPKNGKQITDPVQVEWVDDGVRLNIPVETTDPDSLTNWSQWFPKDHAQSQSQSHLSESSTSTTSSSSSSSGNSSETGDTHSNHQKDDKRLPLALSINNNDNDKITSNHHHGKEPSSSLINPLTIELKCRKCASTGPEAGARAFLMGPQPLSIVLCYNRIQSQQPEVEEILTHELVHLYDVQTLQLDLQKCENLAYSEIRAAKAAECRNSWHPHLMSYCVKQKAICATNNLFPKEGRQCIQQVFDHAFADNRPFASQSTFTNTTANTNPDTNTH